MGAEVEQSGVVLRTVHALHAIPGATNHHNVGGLESGEAMLPCVVVGELVPVLDEEVYRLLRDRPDGQQQQVQVLQPRLLEGVGQPALVLVERGEGGGAAGQAAETNVAAGRAREGVGRVAETHLGYSRIGIE